MNEMLELARALIRRRSITPADEGCQQLLVERLAPPGFTRGKPFLSLALVELTGAR